ncbi:MAG TPA: ABC transporter permease, partial [Polyangiaceae bacterium]|nr:ABC transporter permease [Polyangiaceae bacterium]
ERSGDYWLHESLWQSCQVIFWGFVWAALFGLPIGILCGTFALFSRLFEPFVDFIRYMPAPVFGALAVAILGLGDEPKIAIIFIGTFFQMVLVVSNTTRAVDESLLHAAQTLGANNRQLLLHVVIPGALPNLFRDMRILIGWAWTYLVVAELIGEKSGLSAFLYQQQRYRHFDNVYAGIIMIGIVGLVTDQTLAWLGRYLFPWESGNATLRKVWRTVKRQVIPGARVLGTAN